MCIERNCEQDRVNEFAERRDGRDEQPAQNTDDDGDGNDAGLAITNEIAQDGR